MALTARQSRFADEYLVDLCAYRAAARAGYSRRTAYAAGPRLLKNVEVAREVARLQQERSERTQVTQDRVIEELACIAFSNIGDVLTFGQASASPQRFGELPEDVTAAIAWLSTSRRGIRVRMHDKLGALVALGRHLGMNL